MKYNSSKFITCNFHVSLKGYDYDLVGTGNELCHVKVGFINIFLVVLSERR